MEQKARRISGLPEPQKDFESASKRVMGRGYVKVSEKISVLCGVIPSVVLGILINKHDQEDRYHQLPPNGNFSISIGEIRNRTGISQKTIRKAVDTLANHGLIEYDAGEAGKPYSRRYYRIIEAEIKRVNSGSDTEGNSTLWQNDHSPLRQNDYTPIVNLPHPYSKNAPPPYGKIGIHNNRRTEAGIEAHIEKEKGDGFTDQQIEDSLKRIAQDGMEHHPAETIEGDTPQQNEAATAAVGDGYDDKTNDELLELACNGNNVAYQIRCQRQRRTTKGSNGRSHGEDFELQSCPAYG